MATSCFVLQFGTPKTYNPIPKKKMEIERDRDRRNGERETARGNDEKKITFFFINYTNKNILHHFTHGSHKRTCLGEYVCEREKGSETYTEREREKERESERKILEIDSSLWLERHRLPKHVAPPPG